MKYKGLMIGFMSLLLAACGSDSDDKGEPTFLEGTWVPDYCYDINDDLTKFANSSFKFEGGTITTVNSTFDSSECDDQSKIVEFTTTNTFSLGEEVTLGSGQTVSRIEINMVEADYKPLNESGVAWAIERDFCGKTDWIAGEKESVLDCILSNSEDSGYKQIVYIDDNGELFLGLVPEDDSYPTALDFDEPHIKQ